ncbi:selenium-binding protein SBP56-related protein, partial [Sphingomonas sp.]|uniref:selenium-binding protein SBP56-related protein n=1 Tax=Sphingomonas sp. TaxID=28214 RepID=UPI0025D4AC1F
MRGFLLLGLLCFVASAVASSAAAASARAHYLFVWTGDQQGKGTDFLAVFDGDPASPHYGKLLTTLPTDQVTVRIHHTEYEMPASGMLFANDHDADRTFIFDLRDPLHPRIAASFSDLGGFANPHSFVRIPNGHVLASFQHVAGAQHHGGMPMGGGLVEIDDSGRAVRSAGNLDAAFPNALMMPYSLAVLPRI